MNAIKINQLLAGNKLGQIIDDVLSHSLTDLTGKEFEVTSPPVNIFETNDTYNVEVWAPGLVKTDFNITVENDQLVISSSAKSATSAVETKWTKKEFDFSHFRRIFHLSEVLDVDQIQASYKNGVLHISIPKREEKKATESKKIVIK